MILGALAALGVNKVELLNQIASLGFSDFEINFETVDRSGLSATKANVKVPHEHAHRHLSAIIKIINNSELSETVKTRAVQIFNRLGEAEAKIHNISIEKVHFHEVGAMDAIIDIVAACIGFEMLGVEKFICSKIHVGSGMVKMAHGNYPVPPPAVAELLRNAPVYSGEIKGELVTPTGAAIISAVCEAYGPLPEMRIERTGYGAGTREYENFPNVVRLFLGETENASDNLLSLQSQFSKIQNNDVLVENLSLIETNIDDASPQTLAFVLEKAFGLGALDCWFTPILMKKSRPATVVSILCEIADKEKFTELLFAETTTFGVRVSEIERRALPREIVRVTTEFGEISIKTARLNGRIIKAAPEFEDCRAAALKFSVSLAAVERAATKAFEITETK